MYLAERVFAFVENYPLLLDLFTAIAVLQWTCIALQINVFLLYIMPDECSWKLALLYLCSATLCYIINAMLIFNYFCIVLIKIWHYLCFPNSFIQCNFQHLLWTKHFRQTDHSCINNAKLLSFVKKATDEVRICRPMLLMLFNDNFNNVPKLESTVPLDESFPSTNTSSILSVPARCARSSCLPPFSLAHPCTSTSPSLCVCFAVMEKRAPSCSASRATKGGARRNKKKL